MNKVSPRYVYSPSYRKQHSIAYKIVSLVVAFGLTFAVCVAVLFSY